jgi:hypothetical protein
MGVDVYDAAEMPPAQIYQKSKEQNESATLGPIGFESASQLLLALAMTS